jgi:hypothetical protein
MVKLALKYKYRGVEIYKKLLPFILLSYHKMLPEIKIVKPLKPPLISEHKEKNSQCIANLYSKTNMLKTTMLPCA